jgi:benzylsuccinate CoA-transferase BbsF subunit
MTMRLPPLRVLDFCWVGAGAFVTRILADLGADVIKIESRAHPDSLRLSGPHKAGAKPLESSGYFASRNTGKKSFALNMAHPQGQRIAFELARHCSIVTNNFRPGVMQKWGLGYEQITAINPSVIYLSMPMQGSKGPNSGYIGFGSTIAALCGLVSRAGLPGRPPLGTGTHYPDHIPNPGHSLVALLAAIFHRARTGEGQYIELAQIESTVNMMGPALLDWSATGAVPVATGNRRAGSVPRGVFPCAGMDRWCAIEVADDDRWLGLGAALGSPAWMRDTRFATTAGRTEHEDEIERELGRLTAAFDAADLMRRLQQHGVAASVVETNADVTTDPQLLARGYWQNVAHAEMGNVLANVPPFITDSGERRCPGPPPLLGEHTIEVATSILGYDQAECKRLIDEKVFY